MDTSTNRIDTNNNNEITSLKSAISELEVQLNFARNETDYSKTELYNTLNRITQLNSDNENLKKTTIDKQDLIETLNQEIYRLNCLVSESNFSSDASKDFEEKLKVTESELLREQLHSRQLTEEKNSLLEQLRRKEEYLSKYLEESTELNAKVNDMKAEGRYALDSIDRLQNKIKTLEKDISDERIRLHPTSYRKILSKILTIYCFQESNPNGKEQSLRTIYI